MVLHKVHYCFGLVSDCLGITACASLHPILVVAEIQQFPNLIGAVLDVLNTSSRSKAKQVLCQMQDLVQTPPLPRRSLERLPEVAQDHSLVFVACKGALRDLMEESGGCAPVIVGRGFAQETLERRLGELVLAAWRSQVQRRSPETVHTTKLWPLLLVPAAFACLQSDCRPKSDLSGLFEMRPLLVYAVGAIG